MTDAHEATKQRARDHLRTYGTEGDVRVILRRLAQAFDTLQSVLESAGEARARDRAIAGEWSLHEIADHLLETHRASLEELRCLLAGRRPAGAIIPAGLQSADPFRRPWKALLEDVRRVHADTLQALAAAPPDTPTDVRAPFVMVVRLPDGGPLAWQDEVDWKAYAVALRLHAVDHAIQARNVLGALSP